MSTSITWVIISIEKKANLRVVSEITGNPPQHAIYLHSSNHKESTIFAQNPGGGTCYVGVPGDVPFSWVYFLPENS